MPTEAMATMSRIAGSAGWRQLRLSDASQCVTEPRSRVIAPRPALAAELEVSETPIYGGGHVDLDHQ